MAQIPRYQSPRNIGIATSPYKLAELEVLPATVGSESRTKQRKGAQETRKGGIELDRKFKEFIEKITKQMESQRKKSVWDKVFGKNNFLSDLAEKATGDLSFLLPKGWSAGLKGFEHLGTAYTQADAMDEIYKKYEPDFEKRWKGTLWGEPADKAKDIFKEMGNFDLVNELAKAGEVAMGDIAMSTALGGDTNFLKGGKPWSKIKDMLTPKNIKERMKSEEYLKQKEIGDALGGFATDTSGGIDELLALVSGIAEKGSGRRW